MNRKFSLKQRLHLNLLFWISFIFFSTIPFSASATKWYVKQNATGMNNGLSWHDAFTDLQPALTLCLIVLYDFG